MLQSRNEKREVMDAIRRRAQCGDPAVEMRRSVSIGFKDQSRACEWQAQARAPT
jgi:hypothetical protein